jgi:HPt (histidine-containing phosphotransfer) domain-containing protein
MSQYKGLLFDPRVLPAALEMDDAETLASFYQMFIMVTRESLQELSDCRQSADLTKVKDIAHKLKSSSASIGALQLAEAFRAIESLAAAKQEAETYRLLNETTCIATLSINAVQQHVDSMARS